MNPYYLYIMGDMCLKLLVRYPLNVSHLPVVVSSVPPEPQCAGPPGTEACCPQ